MNISELTTEPLTMKTTDAEPHRDPWEKNKRTLQDAFKPRAPRQYIVEVLAKIPSLNIWYGAPGSMKTFLLQDCHINVAMGEDFLSQAPWKQGVKAFKTMAVPTMFIDFDNGEEENSSRFQALGTAYGQRENENLIYYSYPLPRLNAAKEDDIASLALRIQETGARFVTIDNLKNVSAGIEENSDQMATVMLHLRQLVESQNIVINLIHHERKSNGFNGRKGERLRGHSSIEAAVDLALLVERENNSDVLSIQSTKTRGAEVKPFSAVFSYEHKTGTTELETARFYGLAVDENEYTKAIEGAIINALKDPSNQTALVEAVKIVHPGVGKNYIRTIIKRMAKDKKINALPGKRTAVIYSL